MSELRKEPVLQRWVVVMKDHRFQPSDHCPFCPGYEAETPAEVFALRPYSSSPNAPGWTVRVVPNKYPFLRIEGDLAKRAYGLYDRMNGVGAHEIVVETPEHDQHLGTMPAAQIGAVLQAFRARMLDLRRDPRFKHIMIVKNHGPALSALPHPHSHVVAFPIVPRRIDEELKGTFNYYQFHDRCIYCDMIGQESGRAERMIVETERVACFIPFASRYPYETWILPKNHAYDFGQISDAEIAELADVMRRLFGCLRTALNDPPYSLALHSSPLQAQLRPQYHWHFEIRPRVEMIHGFEWATGLFIHTLPPEEAAARLKAACERTPA